MRLSAIERAKAAVKDIRGRAANYASLCERVNSLGSALAQVKQEYSQLVQEKTVTTTSNNIIYLTFKGNCKNS